MRYIQPEDRSQYVMMNTLDDLIPAAHPVRLLDSIVEEMVAANPERFTLPDRSDADPGRPAYSPQTMLKLFLYGYFINCRASRKLEAETKRNIELIWLLGTLSPDHWVIAAYRRLHADHIKTATQLFRQFLHAHGYIKGERIAVDGTKMKASAKREMLSIQKIEERLSHLDTQLEEYLQRFGENDLRDNLTEELEALETDEKGGDGPSSPLAPANRHLLDKIIELQKRIEDLTAHKDTLQASGQTYLSPSDPEARLMKSRGEGKVPAYNVQCAVDDAAHMIVATEVLTDPDDHHALPVIVQAATEELGGTPPKVILADTGYQTPDEIEHVEASTGAQCYIPLQAQKDSSSSPAHFHYDASTDRYTCPEGKPLLLHQKNKRSHNTWVDVYQGQECDGCRVRPECTKAIHGRMIYRYHNQDWRQKWKERMKRPASKAMSKLRKCLIEHPFGTIKLLGGKLPLLLRGKGKVTTEINLYATVYNFLRLLHCASWERVKEQIASYGWAFVPPRPTGS